MLKRAAIAGISGLTVAVIRSAGAEDSAGVDVSLEDAHVLCYSYSYGHGTVANYASAFRWCSFAADRDVPSAQTLLAELYYFGHGVPQDLEKAAFWYERAAATGHVHAQFMLYQLYCVKRVGDGSMRERGIQMLRKAAAAGYEKAQAIVRTLPPPAT